MIHIHVKTPISCINVWGNCEQRLSQKAELHAIKNRRVSAQEEVTRAVARTSAPPHNAAALLRLLVTLNVNFDGRVTDNSYNK